MPTDERIQIAPRRRAGIILVMLVGSMLSLAIAPLLMPASYSMVANAISESAAQGVDNAWVARVGFLLLGFGVLLVVGLAGPRWGIWGRVAFRVYGVAMIGNAAFSHMPWEDVPYVAFEDTLHSATASATGMSFVAGVLVVMLRRGPGHIYARAFDGLVLVAAVGIPMLMFNVESMAGLLQRCMFGIAYLWFVLELRHSAAASLLVRSEEGRPTVVSGTR